MDSKKKFLYKRQVDPLNPTYMMPSTELSIGLMIGPIDGQRPQVRIKQRQESLLNLTSDIEGAQPKALGAVSKHVSKQRK